MHRSLVQISWPKNERAYGLSYSTTTVFDDFAEADSEIPTHASHGRAEKRERHRYRAAVESAMHEGLILSTWTSCRIRRRSCALGARSPKLHFSVRQEAQVFGNSRLTPTPLFYHLFRGLDGHEDRIDLGQDLRIRVIKFAAARRIGNYLVPALGTEAHSSKTGERLCCVVAVYF